MIYVDLCSYSLHFISSNYYLSGSTYEKDGAKQAKATYNYRDDFKKKNIRQHKTTLSEDVTIQFYQKITGGVKYVRICTIPELARSNRSVIFLSKQISLQPPIYHKY